MMGDVWHELGGPESGPRSETGSPGFLEGKLLIALPGMPDPRFEKSVIFICAHSEEGAMGLIINKPVEGLTFREMMEKLDVETTQMTPDLPILFGGPVQTGRGFVLHSSGFTNDASTMVVTQDVSLTATLDIVQAIAEGIGPSKSLFALGYAGWDGGQVEDEIRANGWLHCDADAQLIFDVSPNDKWGHALRRMGIDLSGLTYMGGNA